MQHQVFMRFGVACILPHIFGFVQVLSCLATSSAPTSNGEVTMFYKNITRTIGDQTISILTTCSYTDIDCENWCLTAAGPVSTAILDDCEADCNDDYCWPSSAKVEFPKNSNQFVNSSDLIERARDEKLARLHTAYYQNTIANTHPSLQRRDLSACLLTCRTFSQFATYIPYIVARTIANGLARLACPAICYKTFGPLLTES
jgi:hypothetical protein